MGNGEGKSVTQLLGERKTYSELKAKAHEDTARRIGGRDTWLALAVILCSLLLTIPTFGFVAKNSAETFSGRSERGSAVQDRGGREDGAARDAERGAQTVSFPLQFAAFILAGGSTVAAGLQKHWKDDAKLAAKHDIARAGYAAVAREAEEATTEEKTPEQRGRALTKINARLAQIESDAPRPYKVFDKTGAEAHGDALS